MITLETLCLNLPQVSSAEIEIWIRNQWVKPETKEGHYCFHEIDEARIRLILELRDHLGVTEDAMPLVLQLIDQLYTTRRQMRYLCEIIATDHYPDSRQKLRRMMDEIIITTDIKS
ncbi:hypothetical protein [Commensalibacter oyaizuii]|uniref:MerR family transcriptional regulator n=1 Tax=Commensalibacter oyaizuii TaxID=3043873 RepID=A0ABT6Q2E0_9PROT|nr:hypothetical protein [Commensalibacter sp. TBRC 16381]MDI2091275.1 hypothetical protein [Commensalibacter sp. TBRC 16381]